MSLQAQASQSTTAQQLEQASKDCLQRLHAASSSKKSVGESYDRVLSSVHQSFSTLMGLLNSTTPDVKNTPAYQSSLALCSLGFSWVESEAKALPKKDPSLLAPTELPKANSASLEFKQMQNLVNATIAGGAIGLSERRIGYLVEELNKGTKGELPGLLTFGFKTKADAESFMKALDWLNVTGIKTILELDTKEPTVGIAKDEYGVLFGVQRNYAPKDTVLSILGEYRATTGDASSEFIQSFGSKYEVSSDSKLFNPYQMDAQIGEGNNSESSFSGKTSIILTGERSWDKYFNPDEQSTNAANKIALDLLHEFANYLQIEMTDPRFKSILQQKGVFYNLLCIATQEAMLTGRQNVTINGVSRNTIEYWKGQLSNNDSLAQKNAKLITDELFRLAGIRCESESHVAVYQSLTGDYKAYAQAHGGYSLEKAQANRNKLVSLLEGYLKDTNENMRKSAQDYLGKLCGPNGAFRKEGDNYVVADAHKLWVIMARRNETSKTGDAFANALNDMRTNELTVSAKETMSVRIESVIGNTTILEAKRTFGDANLDVFKSNLHVFIYDLAGNKQEIPQEEITELGNGRFQITSDQLLKGGKIAAYSETPGGKVNSGLVWQNVAAPAVAKKELVKVRTTYMPYVDLTGKGVYLPAATTTVNISAEWLGEQKPAANTVIAAELIHPMSAIKQGELDAKKDLQEQGEVPYFFARPSVTLKPKINTTTTIMEFEGHSAPLDRGLKVSDTKTYTQVELAAMAEEGIIGYYKKDTNSFHALDGWQIASGLVAKGKEAYSSEESSVPIYSINDDGFVALKESDQLPLHKRIGRSIAFTPTSQANELSVGNKFMQPSSVLLDAAEKKGPNKGLVKFGETPIKQAYVDELAKQNIYALVLKDKSPATGYSIYSVNGEKLGIWDAFALTENARKSEGAIMGLSLRLEVKAENPLSYEIYQPSLQKVAKTAGVDVPSIGAFDPKIYAVGDYYKEEEQKAPLKAAPPAIVKFSLPKKQFKLKQTGPAGVYYEQFANPSLEKPVLTASYSGRALTEREKAYWGDGYPLAVDTQVEFTKRSCDFMKKMNFAADAETGTFVEKQLILNPETKYYEITRGVPGGYSDEQILIWMQHNSTSTIRAANGTANSSGTGTKVWLADAQFSKLKLTGTTQEERVREAVAYITSEKGVSEMIEAQNLWVNTQKMGRVKMSVSNKGWTRTRINNFNQAYLAWKAPTEEQLLQARANMELDFAGLGKKIRKDKLKSTTTQDLGGGFIMETTTTKPDIAETFIERQIRLSKEAKK